MLSEDDAILNPDDEVNCDACYKDEDFFDNEEDYSDTDKTASVEDILKATESSENKRKWWNRGGTV
jgi:hypothetical protein